LCEEASFTTAVNRSKFPPWGVAGGTNETCNYMAIIRDGKEIMRVARIVNYKLRRNDIVSIKMGEGGSWGNPLERDPNLVLRDVINDYITVDVARDI